MVPLKGGDTVEIKVAGNTDLFDLVDAKDIFKTYNEKWCDKVLEIEKWSDKCVHLELMIKDSSIPKI